MTKVFLDTNILIDLLADRPPFSRYAIEVFHLAEHGTLKLYTSTHSLATTHYLLKKYMLEKELRSVLFSLLDFIELIPIDLAVIKKSLLSKHRDFEDAIQMVAASSIEGLDFIVTRNLKDFKGAEVEVLAPDELLNRI